MSEMEPNTTTAAGATGFISMLTPSALLSKLEGIEYSQV